VPRAVPGITVGHELVGVVEEIGSAVATVRPGDRVTVNVETFCGECFFCQHGFVNNCTDPNGGWAMCWPPASAGGFLLTNNQNSCHRNGSSCLLTLFSLCSWATWQGMKTRASIPSC